MTSSSEDDDQDLNEYHRRYPLHDAVEAGDIKTLWGILSPSPSKKHAASVHGVAGNDGGGSGGSGGSVGMEAGGAEGGVVAMDMEGGGTADGGEGDEQGGGDAKADGQQGGGDDNSDDSDNFRVPSPDLEERDPEGCTPLHVALIAKNLQAARVLLESGASTSKRLEGSPPAHIALSVASLGRHRGFADAALKLLLEHHHDVSIKDDRGQTLLHLAASYGLEDALETLLQAPGGKELLESKERLHCRPLHLAAVGGHVGITRALILAGCDTSVGNLHGNTPLHLACTKARWGVARVLLDLGRADDVLACNKNKQTPAALAMKLGLRIPDTLPELQPGGVGGGGGGGGGDNKSNECIGAAPAVGKSKGKKAEWQFAPAGSASAGAGGAVAIVTKRQAEESGGQEKEATLKARTVVLHHPMCLEHHSCPPIRRSGADPPPENVKRLEVIYNEDSGVLRADEFSSLEWESNPRRAQLADVLRVHDFDYVERLERICSSIAPEPGRLDQLDGDTTVSRNSFEAAMRAAGSVCDAVDRVMTGRNRNAFCAVRPPGHHAGTRGLVTCGNDAQGSHGFCLLNNVAIGAAYARCIHRHTGIDKVAIVDFDVHHGNGTEDIVKALVPRDEVAKIDTPFGCHGILKQMAYKPWLNPEDPNKCLFVSVHGYGKKDRAYRFAPGGWFYPGSGQTTDCPIPIPEGDPSVDPSAAARLTVAPEAGKTVGDDGGEGGEGVGRDEQAAAAAEAAPEAEVGAEAEGGAKAIAEDEASGIFAVEREPLVLDVGMPLPEMDDTPGVSRHRWRDVYRNEILPKLVAFDPDIILVSAGFDAHKKDVINFGYIGLLEEDYEWVTQQLVQVANRCCEGRLVSVLEGGYRIQGGIVSAFGRSVAGHVRALVDGCESRQEWSAMDAAWESNFERRLLQERERKRKLRLEQHLQVMEAKRKQLRAALLQQHQQQDSPAAEASASNGDAIHNAGCAAAGAGAPQAAAAGIEEGGRQVLPSPAEGGGRGDMDEPVLPSKRRRANVDYVALQKKLQEEEASGKHRKAAAGTAPGTATETATKPAADV